MQGKKYELANYKTLHYTKSQKYRTKQAKKDENIFRR